MERLIKEHEKRRIKRALFLSFFLFSLALRADVREQRTNGANTGPHSRAWGW